MIHSDRGSVLIILIVIVILTVMIMIVVIVILILVVIATTILKTVTVDLWDRRELAALKTAHAHKTARVQELRRGQRKGKCS